MHLKIFFDPFSNFLERSAHKSRLRIVPPRDIFYSALIELHGRKFGEQATLLLSPLFAMSQSLFDPVVQMHTDTVAILQFAHKGYFSPSSNSF
jgi:hypothetical protein